MPTLVRLGGFHNETAAESPRRPFDIWFEAAMVDRLGAMRGPGESYSDVILRRKAKNRGFRNPGFQPTLERWLVELETKGRP
jgi:hypothetical protein